MTKLQKKKIKIIQLGNFFKKKLIVKKNNHFSNLYKPYLLFVGSVSPRKNLDKLIGGENDPDSKIEKEIGKGLKKIFKLP